MEIEVQDGGYPLAFLISWSDWVIREQMPRKNKNIGNQIMFFILLCIGGLIAGIFLVGWADKYQVVWRYSMLLNAPNAMVLVSIIVVACIIFPLHTWFAKNLKPPKGSNFNNGVYLLDFLIFVPLLLCATQIGIIVNGALDKSEPQTFHAVVVSKREVHTLRANDTYIKIEDWHNPGKPVQIMVSWSNYEAIQIGDSIDVVTKSGFLGYEWVTGPNFMQRK